MTPSRSRTRSRSSSPTSEGSSKRMASLGSSIRSAAQGTSSAYRRLPIRWRLAGGSAALTLVILCGFAAIVGVLTTRQIQQDFNREVSDAATQLASEVKLRLVQRPDGTRSLRKINGPSLDDYTGGQNAAVRIITPSGEYVMGSDRAPNFGPYIAATANVHGWRVESRPVEVLGYVDPLVIQYAQRLSKVEATASRVKEPIAEMTAAAREVERSRDPTVRIPRPDSEDEVAELARTLESMLGALGEA